MLYVLANFSPADPVVSQCCAINDDCLREERERRLKSRAEIRAIADGDARQGAFDAWKAVRPSAHHLAGKGASVTGYYCVGEVTRVLDKPDPTLPPYRDLGTNVDFRPPTGCKWFMVTWGDNPTLTCYPEGCFYQPVGEGLGYHVEDVWMKFVRAARGPLPPAQKGGDEGVDAAASYGW